MGIFRRKNKRRDNCGTAREAVSHIALETGAEVALGGLFRVVGGAVRGLFQALT